MQEGLGFFLQEKMTSVSLNIVLKRSPSFTFGALNKFLLANSFKKAFFYFFKPVVKKRAPTDEHKTPGIVSKGDGSI